MVGLKETFWFVAFFTVISTLAVPVDSELEGVLRMNEVRQFEPESTEIEGFKNTKGIQKLDESDEIETDSDAVWDDIADLLDEEEEITENNADLRDVLMSMRARCFRASNRSKCRSRCAAVGYLVRLYDKISRLCCCLVK